jgi:CRP-like cAMP-binding protein
LYILNIILFPSLFHLDRKFVKDEIVIAKGQKHGAFYVVMSGSMKVTETEESDAKAKEVVLKRGDFYGEQTLISNTSPSANLIGLKDGFCFGIDIETFDKVLGNFSQIITKSKDKLKLSQVKLIKDAEFEESLLHSLADAIVEQKYGATQEIQKAGNRADAALYLVREGSVTISTNEYKQVINTGNYFGADQLLADSRGQADDLGQMISNYTVTCNNDTICGVLTLKECRLLIDTANDFQNKTTKLPDDPGDFLKQRLKERRLLNSFDDFSQDFVLERRAIREFYKGLNTPVDLLPRDGVLGEGQFGQVWKVTLGDKNHRQEFALKIQDLSEAFLSDCLENIYREMQIISTLQHPFIVDLIDSKETDTESYMLMTLCTGGELWNVIHKFHNDGTWESGVKEADAKFYALIIADTVAYMHRKNVLFRDLKPENVLIDEDGYPNIIDFGFAKITTEKTFTLCGTPHYMAPEIVLVSGHSVGADHWALGVMIYEMVGYSVGLCCHDVSRLAFSLIFFQISGEHPFYYEGLDHASLFELITKVEPYPCGKASYEAKVRYNSEMRTLLSLRSAIISLFNRCV